MGRSVIRQHLSWKTRSFWLALALLATLPFAAAHAFVYDGVQLPNDVQANGKTLLLNGYGLRTYSVFGIHIYVVALYVEHPSTDAQAILRSPDTKLLTVKFEHDVGAEEARKAWRTGLTNNCIAPCQLDPAIMEKFLSLVPAMHDGDSWDLLFTPQGATVTVSGRLVGTVDNAMFAQAMLASFLGPRPASSQLKEDLLRRHA